MIYNWSVHITSSELLSGRDVPPITSAKVLPVIRTDLTYLICHMYLPKCLLKRSIKHHYNEDNGECRLTLLH